MTARSEQTSEQLRELGNKAIKSENYHEAERLYTEAIVKDNKNYKLFSNRAMARLKIKNYEGAALDAEAACRLNSGWMKGHRHAAVAYGHLKRYDDAVAAAMQAYAICMDKPDTNRNDLLSNSELVLSARKARWDEQERRRIAGSDPLMNECIDLIWAAEAEAEKRLDELVSSNQISLSVRDKDAESAWNEARSKERSLRDVFAKKDPNLKERNVPDCFIDRISFNFMTDPVVTKHGQSYERSHLLEHLSRNPTDPLTGEPLSPKDLRPNLSLREACEAFLFENEWAADF